MKILVGLKKRVPLEYIAGLFIYAIVYGLDAALKWGLFSLLGYIGVFKATMMSSTGVAVIDIVAPLFRKSYS